MQKNYEKDKLILVTGSAGFIGFHLCKKLLERGLLIIGIDNINNYYDVNLKKSRLNILKKFNNFIFYKTDISNSDELNDVFKKHNFSFVVNLAAQSGVRYSIINPKVYIESNIIGFFNILEVCRYHEIEHLIYASSSSVYGNQKKIPFSIEDNVDQPISLYAMTKKSNELMAHTYSYLYGIPSTGLRFFTVYGEYGRPDMAYFSFTNKIINDVPIKVFNNGDLYRDFTYIDDIVIALEKIIFSVPKKNNGVKYKVYNIGNNKSENILHFIEVLEDCIGKKAKKEYLPMQAGDVYQTYADVQNLVDDFNFRPQTNIEDGLKVFVDWYKEYY